MILDHKADRVRRYGTTTMDTPFINNPSTNTAFYDTRDAWKFNVKERIELLCVLKCKQEQWLNIAGEVQVL